MFWVISERFLGEAALGKRFSTVALPRKVFGSRAKAKDAEASLIRNGAMLMR